MRFSEHFGLRRAQPELDFVDIEPGRDLPLFIDPYVLTRRDDAWSQECAADIRSFFQAAIDAIRAGDHPTARRLLNDLSEPNETCLGFSRGTPSGRGVSGKQAFDLYERLAESRAVQTGFLEELSDCELIIPGIGEDKISDITTNIIRRLLIQYTQRQCELHGIALTGTVASGRLWDPEGHCWTQAHVRLPVVNGRRIILVPKAAVYWRMTLDHQEYLQHFVLNFLQDEHLEAGSQLVQVLKNGRRRVTKRDLMDDIKRGLQGRELKEFLYEFSKQHPGVLDAYKKAKGGREPLSDRELAELELTPVDEQLLARALSEMLGRIPSGGPAASEFHRLMIGVLEFLFYPNLINPQKEHEIHEGRKRIDITYTNAAHDGVFRRAAMHPDMTAKLVMVECKNYTSDPENPELDQLGGRFSHARGRFGLLIARTFTDAPLFMRRCRDTAADGRGYILPMVDDDILRMLDMVSRGRRQEIDGYLDTRFTSLLS